MGKNPQISTSQKVLKSQNYVECFLPLVPIIHELICPISYFFSCLSHRFCFCLLFQSLGKTQTSPYTNWNVHTYISNVNRDLKKQLIIGGKWILSAINKKSWRKGRHEKEELCIYIFTILPSNLNSRKHSHKKICPNKQRYMYRNVFCWVLVISIIWKWIKWPLTWSMK